MCITLNDTGTGTDYSSSIISSPQIYIFLLFLSLFPLSSSFSFLLFFPFFFPLSFSFFIIRLHKHDKKTFLTGFLRISFFPRFPEDFFSGMRCWRGSQEFLVLPAFTVFFCRNSYGTVIPVFAQDSSGFLFPPNAVLLWPATKVGFLLSKSLLK